jgi:hypothetical protein
MMVNPDCHFGDHWWLRNGQCRDCSAFNGGWLNWMRVEKAQREGRHHGDHFHLTDAIAAAGPRKSHAEGPCANAGGCLVHEASDEVTAMLGEPA